jgi:hypothetical protein
MIEQACLDFLIKSEAQANRESNYRLAKDNAITFWGIKKEVDELDLYKKRNGINGNESHPKCKPITRILPLKSYMS